MNEASHKTVASDTGGLQFDIRVHKGQLLDASCSWDYFREAA